MIPDAPLCRVELVKHRISHKVLREFCRVLYSSRDELGELATADTWRVFVRPIWAFHNRAVAAPSPLNTEGLLSPSERQQIETGHCRLDSRSTTLTNHAQHVRETLEECIGSDNDAFGEAFRSALCATRPDAVLLPEDDPALTRLAQNAVLDCGFHVDVLTRAEQRLSNERLRRGVNAVVLGKASRLDRSIFRANLGCVRLTVVQYDWVADMTPQELAGPSLSWLESGDESSTPYVIASTQTVSHGHRTSPANSALIEERPYSRPELWESFQAGPRLNVSHDQADEDDSGEAGSRANVLPIVLLDENAELLAALEELDRPIQFARRDPHGVRLMDGRVHDLRPHDALIEWGPPHDQETISALADEDLRRKGLFEKAKATQRKWKNSLDERVRRLGAPRVAQEIAQRCQAWRPGPERVLEWCRKETLGPQRKDAFQALCDYLRIGNHAVELWSAYNAIKHAHIDAGRKLKQRLCERIDVHLAAAGVDTTRATSMSFAGRSITTYPVVRIGSRPREVPAAWVGRVTRLDWVDLDDLVEQ